MLSGAGLGLGSRPGEDKLTWVFSNQCSGLSWTQGKETKPTGTASGGAFPNQGQGGCEPGGPWAVSSQAPCQSVPSQGIAERPSACSLVGWFEG